MPIFAYKAKDGPVKTIEGEVQAESRTAALDRIDEMGYSPVWVREMPPKGKGRALRRRISTRDITVFTRQLASLTKSGVPILRSLRTIESQSENSRLQRIVAEIQATIRDGSMLSEALSHYPRLFPELYVNMVKAGESSGMLDTTLFRLSEARESEEDFRRKVQAAMAYPLLVLVVGLVTVFVLLSFFLPRVVALYRDYTDLPLPTRILIATSGFFSQNWHWMLLGFLLLAAVFNRLMAIDKGRLLVHGVLLRTPLARAFIRCSDIARFSRTLSLLLTAGVPIDRSLSLSAATLRNMVLAQEIETVRRNTVDQGHALSAGLQHSPHFPNLLTNMVGVGEEAGRLDESLLEVAAYYEKEVDQLSRFATSLLEPALILGVGAMVGFIVAAMLLPVFQIGTGL